MTRFPSSVHHHGDEPDARFTLANERTFLAWIRTSLALIAGQLHRAALASNRIRYTSGGTTRAITGWYYPGAGAQACNYGRTTGNKFSTRSAQRHHVPVREQERLHGHGERAVSDESVTVYGDRVLKRPGALTLGVVILLVATTVTVAGCSGGVAVHDHGSTAMITDAGFLTGDEAAISGTISLTEAGCLGITDAHGNSYPTVWPRGTTVVDEAAEAIDIPGVGLTRLGEPVEGTGGYYEIDTRAVLNEVAERCDWDGEVIGIRFE